MGCNVVLLYCHTAVQCGVPPRIIVLLYYWTVRTLLYCDKQQPVAFPAKPRTCEVSPVLCEVSPVLCPAPEPALLLRGYGAHE